MHAKEKIAIDPEQKGQWGNLRPHEARYNQSNLNLHRHRYSTSQTLGVVRCPEGPVASPRVIYSYFLMFSSKNKIKPVEPMIESNT